MFKSTLLQRWMLVIYGIVILMVLALGVTYYQFEKKHIKTKIETELLSIAELKANQIAIWRKERLTGVTVFTESPYFKQTVCDWLRYKQPEDIAYIKTRMELYSEHYDELEILLVGKHNNIQFSLSNKISVIDSEVLETINEAREQRHSVLTDIHTGHIGKSHIGGVSPLFCSENGQDIYIGSIIIVSSITDFLIPLMSLHPIKNNTSETVLIRRDGNDVVFLNEFHRTGAPLSMRIPVTETKLPSVRAVLGYEDVYYGKDHRGVKVISAAKAIPNSAWHIITKQDAKEAFSEWRNRSILILMLIILTITITTVVVAVIWKNKEYKHYINIIKAENALEESEHYYRNLIDTGQMLVWTIGTDKKVNYYNKPWTEFIGHPMNQDKEYGWSDLIYPEDVDKYIFTYNTLFDRQHSFKIIYRLQRYDGEYRWVQDDVFPHYNRKSNFLAQVYHFFS